MPEAPTPAFKIERLVYLSATLPNGRRAELKGDQLRVWTRAGEELVFARSDVEGMRSMFLEAEKS